MTRSQVFRAAFPGLAVIHLIRRDVVRQAVSWARAAQDGVWIVSATEPAQPVTEPHYDYEFVSGLEGLIREGEEGWRQLYAELEVIPHEVAYEDPTDAERYPDCLVEILRHLDLDAGFVPAPRTERQADRLNDEWAERYLADRVNRDAATS